MTQWMPVTIDKRPLPNVWLGVSVEDRKYGLPRVDVLRTIPIRAEVLTSEIVEVPRG